MSRAHCRETIINRSGATRAGVQVTVCEAGTDTPIAQTMYAAVLGGGDLTNPLTTDANGQLSFFLDNEQYVNMHVDDVSVVEDIEYVPVLRPGLGGNTMTGTVDPSAGAGVAAELSTQYNRTNGTAGELYVKTGPSDVEWSRIV